MVDGTRNVATSAGTSDDGLLSLGFGLPDLRPPRIEKMLPYVARKSLESCNSGISEESIVRGINTGPAFFFESLATGIRIPQDKWLRWSHNRGSSPIAGIGGWSMRRYRARSIVLLVESSYVSHGIGWRCLHCDVSGTTAVYVRNVHCKPGEVVSRSKTPLCLPHPDYEPGFYPWSIWYADASSTYNDHGGTVAVFNSRPLADYFTQEGPLFLGAVRIRTDAQSQTSAQESRA